ncbi:MAG TPA: SRPBCC family protein [Rhizomicrobium sp.]|nr:SRPBCC family protein [Rhizomicrobium sp.]
MDNYATRPDEHTVQFVRILPGPIERIWEFLWDGKKRGEWFASGDMPSKPGESFEMHFKHSTLSPNQAPPPERFIEMDKNGHHSRNVLLAYEPPRRLVFTFGDEKDFYSEVEFRLDQEGEPADNKVRFTLTHSKIPDRNFAVNVSGGWHSHLAILQYKAEGKAPPAFWDVWRETDGAYEKRY